MCYSKGLHSIVVCCHFLWQAVCMPMNAPARCQTPRATPVIAVAGAMVLAAIIAGAAAPVIGIVGLWLATLIVLGVVSTKETGAIWATSCMTGAVAVVIAVAALAAALFSFVSPHVDAGTDGVRMRQIAREVRAAVAGKLHGLTHTALLAARVCTTQAATVATLVTV